MGKNKKTIVVGLDAACWDYLNPLLNAGHLPTLRSFMDAGIWGTLLSTMPPWTPAAWSSIVTGKNPGKHGIYDLLWRRPGSYEFIPINATRLICRKCAKMVNWIHGISNYRIIELREQCWMDHWTLSPRRISMSKMSSFDWRCTAISRNQMQSIDSVSMFEMWYSLESCGLAAYHTIAQRAFLL